MSNYSKNKKVSISSVIAIILGILLVVSVFIGTGTICWGWFSSNESAADTTAAADEDNFLLEQTESNGVTLSMVSLGSNNELGGTTYSGTVEIGGESIDYESSYEVTATVDEEATDRTITWTLSCSGISNISSYVVLSSDTSESGESITVYCLKAFSKQITLTATCGSVTATCTLDYVARISNYYICNSGHGYDFDEVGDGESEECLVYDYFLSSSSSPAIWTTTEGTTGKLLSMSLSSSNNYYYEDCIFSDYEITTTTGYYYGTGSVKEEFSNPVYTITLDSTVAEALGVKTNTYTVTDWLISVDDILNSMFGVTNAMSQTSYKSKVYNVCQSYYTSKTAIFTVSVNATGSITGESYSFDTSVRCNMSGYNVAATSVSLDNTELYF